MLFIIHPVGSSWEVACQMVGTCGNHGHQDTHLVREFDVLEECRPVDTKVKEEGLKMTRIPTSKLNTSKYKSAMVSKRHGFIVPVTHLELPIAGSTSYQRKSMEFILCSKRVESRTQEPTRPRKMQPITLDGYLIALVDDGFHVQRHRLAIFWGIAR